MLSIKTRRLADELFGIVALAIGHYSERTNMSKALPQLTYYPPGIGENDGEICDREGNIVAQTENVAIGNCMAAGPDLLFACEKAEEFLLAEGYTPHGPSSLVMRDLRKAIESAKEGK